MMAIFKKELRAFFLNPAGYIFMGLFLFLSGLLFVRGNLMTGSNSITDFLDNILFVFLFVIPILTMRLLCDEKRLKTDQLLLTSPLRIVDIVLGKFFAALIFFIITLSFTFIYPIIIGIHGDLDFWETVCGYLGFILLSSSFISIGLFISGTTDSQIISAIITFVVLFIVWLMTMIQQVVPVDLFSGVLFTVFLLIGITILLYLATKNRFITIITLIIGLIVILFLYVLSKEIFIGFIIKFLDWFSLIKRFNSFSMGVLKLSDSIYYISFTSFFIFLTIQLIQKRRWS